MSVKHRKKVTWTKDGFPEWSGQRMEFSKEIPLDAVIAWPIREAHLTFGTLAKFLKRINKDWRYRFGDEDIFEYVYNSAGDVTTEQLHNWILGSNDKPKITKKDLLRIEQLREEYRQKCLEFCQKEWKKASFVPTRKRRKKL
jgi:hypothetical protein